MLEISKSTIVLLIYSCRINKKEKLQFEEETRKAIVPKNQKIVVVFYNTEEDSFDLKWDKILKSRFPNVVVFDDCGKETVEKYKIKIVKKAKDSILYFSKRLDGEIYQNVEMIKNLKQIKQFLTSAYSEK